MNVFIKDKSHMRYRGKWRQSSRARKINDVFHYEFLDVFEIVSMTLKFAIQNIHKT